MHTIETVLRTLAANGIEATGVKDIQAGRQISLASGGNINVYRTGRALPQGRNADALRALLSSAPDAATPPVSNNSFTTTPAMLAGVDASFPLDPSYRTYRNPDWSADLTSQTTCPF